MNELGRFLLTPFPPRRRTVRTSWEPVTFPPLESHHYITGHVRTSPPLCAIGGCQNYIKKWWICCYCWFITPLASDVATVFQTTRNTIMMRPIKLGNPDSSSSFLKKREVKKSTSIFQKHLSGTTGTSFFWARAIFLAEDAKWIVPNTKHYPGTASEDKGGVRVSPIYDAMNAWKWPAG